MKALQQIAFFLLGIALSLGAAADPQSKTPNAAHLAAAERVVYAMGLPERFIIPTEQLLKNSLERDPDNAALMSATMAPYLKKSYTARELKAYFAGQFDLDTCRKIAAFWEGPVGRKLVRNQVQALTTGETPQLVFTDAERALIQRFEATKASKAFVSAIPEIEDKLAEYTKNTQMKMREQFLTELGKQTKKAATSN